MKFLPSFLVVLSLSAFSQPGFDPTWQRSMHLEDSLRHEPTNTKMAAELYLLTQNDSLFSLALQRDQEYRGEISYIKARNSLYRGDTITSLQLADISRSNGNNSREWHALKADLNTLLSYNEQAFFLDKCIRLFPKDFAFLQRRAYLQLKYDDPKKADQSFKDALLFSGAETVFYIERWIEALDKVNREMTYAWLDQLNISGRSLNEIYSAHFFCGHWYVFHLNDCSSGLPYFNMCITDKGFDEANVDYNSINGATNSPFYYRGIANYTCGKKEEAYTDLMFAIMWSVEEYHFEKLEELNKLIVANPNDHVLQFIAYMHRLNRFQVTKEKTSDWIFEGIQTILKLPKDMPRKEIADYYLAMSYKEIGLHKKGLSAFKQAEKSGYKPYFYSSLKRKLEEIAQRK